MESLNDKKFDNAKDWEKPTLVKLSVSLTKEEDCTGKIGPGSPDGNTTCIYAGVVTS